MNELTTPHIIRKPVTKTRVFFSRDDVFNETQNNLSDRYTKKILVVYDRSRTGKISALKQPYRHLHRSLHQYNLFSIGNELHLERKGRCPT